MEDLNPKKYVISERGKEIMDKYYFLIGEIEKETTVTDEMRLRLFKEIGLMYDFIEPYDEEESIKSKLIIMNMLYEGIALDVDMDNHFLN